MAFLRKRHKTDDSRDVAVAEKAREIAQTDDTWDKEIAPLKEKDPDLYDIAIHLHLDPMKSTSQELKDFLGKDVDVTTFDPEAVAAEAERYLAQGNKSKAMTGYICAIGLSFLQATMNPTKGGYDDRVTKYSSRLREIDEKVSASSEEGILWYGLVKPYGEIGARANDVLKLATRIYSSRIRSAESASV